MPNKFSSRFAELQREATAILQTISPYGSSVANAIVGQDDNAVLNWALKAKHLIGIACGQDSAHYEEFTRMDMVYKGAGAVLRLNTLLAVFHAAQSDFNGGYFDSIRSLIQAQVFGTELEQATELLQNGYKVPAAVVAGIVLETALRELCDRNQIQHGKLDKMNADLAKNGTYNLLMQKRITALAQIRNDAAHGKHDQFNETDVERMIADVERFLADYLH
jgi:hypothetical protein